MAELTSKDIKPGFVVEQPGGAREYKTGDWRSQKPQYDRERCIKCGVCYLFCPEASANIQADGTIKIDGFYCKGCGICARECPTGALAMVGLGELDDKE